MSKRNKEKNPGRGKWTVIYIAAFIIALAVGAASKQISPSWSKDYKVDWNDSMGTIYSDLSYGDADANKFDLIVPADTSRDSYGLVVYLHAGGFTSGDKMDDTAGFTGHDEKSQIIL